VVGASREREARLRGGVPKFDPISTDPYDWLNHRHLHRVVAEYIRYFNATRPH
jgi:hypothetical protein